MTVYRIDPLQDPRWEEFVESHLSASVFHTRAWLEALRRTYKYEPVVFTTSPPEVQLTDGIPFCHINSWLTGSRLVSVAFADHCQPLTSTADGFARLITYLQRACEQEKWKFVELRLLTTEPLGIGSLSGLNQSASFCFHALDLRPDLETLFRGLHKSCIQRKIRRAQTEGLVDQEGVSDSILRAFYSLLVLTRQRHGLPPQPLEWFRNLRDCFPGRLKIRVVCKDGRPLASILTLHHKNRLVYKYGCSDARYHKLGGMPLLFWRTIQEGKQLGVDELDLGRSDLGDSGLIDFKEHLGASASRLNYYRYPPQARGTGRLGKMVIVRHIFAHLPTSALRAAGNFLYRHVG